MTTICVTPETTWLDPDVDPCTSTLPWVLDMSCCTAIPTSPTVEQVAMIQRMKAAAIDVMYQKTCRTYRCHVNAIRPCVDCSCGDVCTGCCEYRYLDITMWGGGPVISVASIKVDGLVISSTNYWVEGNRLIPKRDGELWCWPPQDRNLPSTEESTWEIEYVRGRKPPALILVAAADLACQLIKYCLNAPCDLPANAVSVTRDGVTISLETGLAAIPTVKMALETYGDCDKQGGTRLIDPVNFGSLL